MRRFLTILVVIISAFIGAVSGVVLTLRYVDSMPAYNSIENRQNLMLTRMGLDSSKKLSAGPNFEYAARMITPAVVHISAQNLARLELHLPPLPEQTAIAEVLSDMDAEIVALEHVAPDIHLQLRRASVGLVFHLRRAGSLFQHDLDLSGELRQDSTTGPCESHNPPP